MDRNTAGKTIHDARYMASGLIPPSDDPGDFASNVWDVLSEEVKEGYRVAGVALAEKLFEELNGGVFRVDDGKIRTIMSTEELAEIFKAAGKHTHYAYPENEHLLDVVERAIYILERDKDNQVLKLKRFQDDILTYLRAVALVADTVGNAGTHKEKDARLRGLISQIESAIQRIRDGYEYLLTSCHGGTPDLFRSDFPIQQYIKKCRELESEIKFLKGESTQSDDFPI